MMIWKLLHPRMTAEHLGFVPDFFDENDPRPAAVQVEEKYIGGWRPLPGFKLLANDMLTYTGDEPLRPLAECQFRDERLLFYQSSWLAIVQPDGSYEVSRMD